MDDKEAQPVTDDKTSDEVEASLDAEMQTDDNKDKDKDKEAPADNMNLDGPSDEPEVPAVETRIPAKKDVALRDFLDKMDDYAPIVRHLLSSSLYCAR